MTTTTELNRGGEPHANEPAAPATPSRHVNDQETTEPRSADTTPRANDPQVTRSAGTSRRRAGADTAGLHTGPGTQPLEDRQAGGRQLPERTGGTINDVPAQVLADLDAAMAATPGPLGTRIDAATRAAWWTAHADAGDAKAAAYARLYQWAVDTQQPTAVTMAIANARWNAETRAAEDRAEAARAGQVAA